ncbi:MAG: AAA family ATPase [Chloroflexi bacterium]|nr:AAA family ATPase [Chloroflexota bacterium]
MSMDLAPVICSSCGTANQAGRKFCAQCGTGLGRACAVCGTLNPPSDRFCGECGSALADAPAASPTVTASAESSAERRVVSVMFADLVGFTTLAEGRDAEETRELLTRYFDVARSVIERHGGTVEKFIGDAVMAVWGAPTAHEDDAERAVRAAMELVAAVPGLGDEAHPLQARAGVLTGEAAVTLGATNQGIVAGDMVNTASRLQSAAAPGTVLVGEATAHAAANAISFEQAGDHALRGKASPIPAWRAVAVVARRGGSGRAATLEPPFVGRDDELRLLKELFDATAREQKSRLVTVIGQAGIGKSRLAWEFEKYLDGVVDTAYWHEGRSPSYGEGISYWALAEMVRRRAGIAEGDDDATVRRRLSAMLEEFILDPAERRWIEPPLAGLLGLAELPTEGREELFAAWRTFFERMAAMAPVVMLFSDLQWADQGLLDFVEDLLHWARGAPIFVVASARPELLERRSGFGGRVRSVARISLEPLGNDAMRRLLEGLVPGLPAAALRSMVQRAEGIPLYAVETVRMLLDREMLVATDGGYQLVGELDGLGVADTLQALIASRLDANRPEDRALLLDASVLGQSFTVEALAAVSGTQPTELSDRLDRLVRRELLSVEADPRSPERGQYMFVQALVREVAYQNLAKADRRQRHLAAARYFEGLGSDELAGVLATHYLAAYQASRPGEEADALAAQARIALQAAAERASSLHSHRQALAHLEQAMIVTQDPAEQALLHLRAAELGDLSSRDAGLRHAEQARDLFKSLGDARGALRAATWVGRHLTSAKREVQGIETFETAIAEAEAIRDSAEYAEALAELSRVYMMSQRSEEAVATADRAMELAGRHRQTRAVVEALINKGTALAVLGRTVEAESVLRGAIAVADRNNLSNAALRARNNLLALLQDSVPEQVELMRESYEMAVRMGHIALRQQFAMALVESANHLGDADRWLSEMAVIEEAEELSGFFEAGFAAARSLNAALRGDLEEATAQGERASRAAATLQSVMVNAGTDLLRGELAFFRGDWSTAARLSLAATENGNFVLEGAIWAAFASVAGDLRAEVRAVIAVDRESPYLGRMTSAALAAAEAGLAAREGRWAEVHGGYRKALDAIHESGYFIYEAMTGLEWGMLAGSRDPEALAAGEAGAAFFADRGAAVVVERYRAAFVPVSGEESPARIADPARSGVPSG